MDILERNRNTKSEREWCEFQGERVPKDADMDEILDFLEMVDNTRNDLWDDCVEIYTWSDYEKWIENEHKLANEIIDEFYSDYF